MNKGAPTKHPLARIGAYGHPWHGIVTGGVLTLPGGSTRTYPQPNSTYMWEAVAAHRMYVPGTPEVSRTVAQQSDDAANGYQWFDYAVMSGGSAQLYSKALGAGRFVWVDTAGDRWLIDASDMHNKTWTAATVPSSVWVRIRKFGVFGATDAERAIEVAMPSLGQASPDVYDGATLRNNFVSSLYSVHPQGRAAAFMLHYQLAAAKPSGRHPCGWYELQLSGTGDAPVISIAALHDRAATLGTDDVGSDVESHGGDYHLWTKTETVVVAGDAYPACGGYTTVTTDAALVTGETGPAGYTRQWDYGGGNILKMETEESRTKTLSWSGMVLAIWYDATGDKITTTIGVDYASTLSKTGTSGPVTGQRILRYDRVAGAGACENVQTVVQAYSMSISYTSTYSQSATITLKNNGITVSSKTIAASGSSDAMLTVSGTGNGIADADGWALSTSASYALTGAGWSGEPGASGSVSGSYDSGTAIVPAAGLQAKAGGGPESVGFGGRGVRANNLYAYTYNTIWASDANKRTKELMPSRLGHAVIGWLMSDTPYITGITEWTVPVDAATPGGASISSDWNYPGASYTSTVIFVTRHPVSGDLYASTTPACYV